MINGRQRHSGATLFASKMWIPQRLGLAKGPSVSCTQDHVEIPNDESTWVHEFNQAATVTASTFSSAADGLHAK
jgi:hypothetical protein